MHTASLDESLLKACFFLVIRDIDSSDSDSRAASLKWDFFSVCAHSKNTFVCTQCISKSVCVLGKGPCASNLNTAKMCLFWEFDNKCVRRFFFAHNGCERSSKSFQLAIYLIACYPTNGG